MTVGILALQGCIEPHIRMFHRLGAECIRVTDTDSLKRSSRLVMPGGESTTMLTLLSRTGITDAIIEFSKSKPVWGVCAGAILLSKEVEHPKQSSLKAMEISANRNYYGSQLESFKATVKTSLFDAPMDVDFIRAPLLRPLSKEVAVHAVLDGNAVLLQQGRILASAFHTELGDDTRLHQYFLTL